MKRLLLLTITSLFFFRTYAQDQRKDLGILQIDPTGHFYIPAEGVKSSERNPDGFQNFAAELYELIVADEAYVRTPFESQLNFTVREDGSIANVFLSKKGNANDQVFINSLMACKKWKPAVRIGQLVSQNFSLLLVTQDMKIYTLVDQPATFPSGGIAFNKWITENIQIPMVPTNKRTSGRVFVMFIVEPDSTLSDFKVVKGLGQSFDEEALRLMKNSPNWIPGRHRGRLVRQQMIWPVHFN